jgi:hypothetical protein
MTATVRVMGGTGSPVETKVPFTAGSIHTVVVLDGSAGLKLLDLSDTARGKATPRGGVDTGLGGLAQPPHQTFGRWAVGGALAALGGLGFGLVRLRRRA